MRINKHEFRQPTASNALLDCHWHVETRMYIYIYIYMYVYVCIYIYIYHTYHAHSTTTIDNSISNLDETVIGLYEFDPISVH